MSVKLAISLLWLPFKKYWHHCGHRKISELKINWAFSDSAASLTLQQKWKCFCEPEGGSGFLRESTVICHTLRFVQGKLQKRLPWPRELLICCSGTHFFGQFADIKTGHKRKIDLLHKWHQMDAPVRERTRSVPVQTHWICWGYHPEWLAVSERHAMKMDTRNPPPPAETENSSDCSSETHPLEENFIWSEAWGSVPHYALFSCLSLKIMQERMSAAEKNTTADVKTAVCFLRKPSEDPNPGDSTVACSTVLINEFFVFFFSAGRVASQTDPGSPFWAKSYGRWPQVGQLRLLVVVDPTERDTVHGWERELLKWN